MNVAAPSDGYSYQGQDLFVLDVLGGLRGGYFIDSGASNGLRGSNTKLLESAFGWSGICIEPNASLFAELVRNRNCVCLNCCLYDRAGTVDFLEAAGVLGGILAEYDPDHLRYARAAAGESVTGRGGPEAVSKPARTVRSVLRGCGAPRVIDYWSLDTEGSELAILKSFPFSEYFFRVLTVEHNRTPAREQIRRFLERREYRWIRSLGIDDCYAWNGTLPDHAWRSRVWGRRSEVAGGDFL
jgi:FkbM family methyltransferase